MSHSLCFLTATWLAAQAPPPGTVRVEHAPAVEHVPGAAHGWVSPNAAARPERRERRGLFARLQTFFSGKNHQRQKAYQWQGHPSTAPGAHHPIHTNEPPLAAPSRVEPLPGPQSALQPAPLTQVGHGPAPAPVRLDLPVRAPYRDKIGHDGKYGWVTGQLVRLQSDRDLLWVLVYATPEVQDPHGGSLLLNAAVDMLNYRDGDLVSVRGELLNGGQPSQHFGMRAYRAAEVNLIERGD